MRLTAILFCILVLRVLSIDSLAASPPLINYQGQLTDTTGFSVKDSSYSLTFSIWDDSSTGVMKWTETRSVQVEGGVFSVLLGAINPIPDSVFSGPDRWLGVKMGSNPELMPRQRFVSVAYAMKSQVADTATFAERVDAANFNPSFPDGLEGITPLTKGSLGASPYTVPASKNLYITNVWMPGSQFLLINGKKVVYGPFNTGDCSPQHLTQPIIAGGGDVVSAQSILDDVSINGFLVEATVIPITMNTLFTSPFTVPSGKTFYVTNVYSEGSELYIESPTVASGRFNWGGCQHLGLPLIIGEGQTIFALADNLITINGYLRDK